MKKLGVSAIDNSAATHIVATDEVGLGSWAGPLCIGVVCAPRSWIGPTGLTDSKALSWDELMRLSDAIRSDGETIRDFHTAIYTYEHHQIDRMGVGKLLPWAHETAIEGMVKWCRERGGNPLAIVDGNMCIAGAVSLPKADLLVPACSAASIIAKVHHDKLMIEYDKTYPGYDFANSVGYTSPGHIAGLEKLGPSPIHRQSYASYNRYKKSEEPQNMWELLEED